MASIQRRNVLLQTDRASILEPRAERKRNANHFTRQRQRRFVPHNLITQTGQNLRFGLKRKHTHTHTDRPMSC